MPSIGWPELVIILAVAMLLFGPQRLAGIGGALGRAIREFRGAVRETENELEKSSSSSEKKNT
jgi:sec-independent protein translocase protein TatA